ncbi:MULTISPECIES: Flp family type IVb pilin [unclassified Paraburkholderia]|uniref:Flp family type IVb pilin n=1 Tax=unclassified Paraburkholderia TaxID=2615204 RepID=UPI00286F32E0|nr:MULTISPECIES: Flp family type IVb pilin [unclassified Paraburkholderia]
MNKLVKLFAQSEEGVTALEYGLIAGLIAVVIAASASSLGTQLSSVFTYITNQLTTSVPSTKT